MTVRVLTISKPYVSAAYRTKLVDLSRVAGLDVGLVCPEAWGEQRFEPDPSADGQYWNRRLPIVLNGKNHFHLYRGLEAAMRAFRPDVVNIEEEHYSAVTWQAYRAALACGAKPVFYTWQNIAKRYPPPFSWIEQYVFRHSAAAVAGNQEAADILREKGYQGTLRVIPQMGVAFASFRMDDPSEARRTERKRELGLEPGRFWIGFAGRVVAEKGLGTLIDAVAALAPADRDRVGLLILGDGPERGALITRATELRLDAVRFEAQVASQEVARYLKAIDALCLPSLTRPNWKEQFGRILVEAMAARALVIGSSSGEIPNVIGDDGLVFREASVADLRQTIERALRQPDLVAALTDSAFRKAADRYTSEAIAGQFAELFFDVAARP